MDSAGSRGKQWAVVCLLSLARQISAQSCRGNPVIRDNVQKVQNYFDSNCTSPLLEGSLTVQSLHWPATSVQQGRTNTIPLGALETISGSLTFRDIKTNDGSAWTIDGQNNLINVDSGLTFSQLENLAMPHFEDLTTSENLIFHDVNVTAALLNYSMIWPNLWAVTSTDLQRTDLSSFEIPNWQLTPYSDSTDAYILAIDNPQLRSLRIEGYPAGYLVHTTLRGNNEALIVEFPNVTAGTFNLSGVNEFYAPTLVTLGSQTFDSEIQTISSNAFTSLNLSAVSSAYGVVEIDSNPSLETLDLSSLGSVTNLRIANNKNLREIKLPELRSVSQSLYIEGPIDSIEAPNAQSLVGDVTIITSGSFDCSDLVVTRANGESPSCKKVAPSGQGGGGGLLPGATQTPTSDNGDQAGSSSGGLAQGAQIGIGVGVGVGGLAIIAAIVIFCCVRRKRKQRISPRSAGSNEFYMEPKGGVRGDERSPARYTKVHSGSIDHSSEERVSPDSQFAPSGHFRDASGGAAVGSRFREEDTGVGDNWAPPEQRVPNTDGRVELEEQQGMRHEMDARSLQDMDLEDDREETRSLEDIERAHGQR